ncbi:DUF6262 family protein [Paenibacillus thiaminolyticus]|uniref:DUF6262 family protein n=1 Tax=Paenibacillus thiaminolyticus TaxID=49283 RepID=UPI0035A69E06
MSDFNRTEQLKAIHKARKEATKKKVDEAIQRLLRVSQSINFNSVASEAGITKATLYRNQELRERIESLRNQQSQAPSQKQLKRDLDENNKDAIIALLQRRIKKLEEELKQLREQQKISYGDLYKKI